MNLEEILRQIVRDGDTVLDVGGHVGNVARFMVSRVGKRGAVFSFEPNPDKFKSLKRQADKYQNLHCYDLAVGNSLTPVTLYYGLNEKSDQASTICIEQATRERFGEAICSIEVPSITLDKFCAENRLKPAIIKIDVEGAEPLVLEGATAVLREKPILIFEIGVYKTMPSHLATLRALGYKLFLIDIHRFVTEPATFDDIVNSETRSLRNCILTFTDSAAESLTPFLGNVLAVDPIFHGKRLIGLNQMDLIAASKQFADPRTSLSRKIKRFARKALIPNYVEEQFPQIISNLRHFVTRFL